MEAQLRDSNWRLQQLQTQYDFLVSKTSSQSSAVKQTEEQMEDYAQKVRDLRRALEELRHEKEYTDAKAARSDEMEDLVKELKRDNRSLEEKIAGLSKDPFIRGAFEQQDSRMAYEDAIRDRDEMKKKFQILQESVRTHYASLTGIRCHTIHTHSHTHLCTNHTNHQLHSYAKL